MHHDQQDRSILIIGMSHAKAIDRALTSCERERIEVIQLLQKPDMYNAKTLELDVSQLSALHPKRVFALIGGNYHNVFGLTENPQPFSMGDAVQGRVPLASGRHFIPRDMLAAHFRQKLSPWMHNLKMLRERFSEGPFDQVCSPPPVPDNDHLRKHPGAYRERMVMGPAPKDLRMSLYRLHTELFKECCDKIGIGFISPPSEALDNEGFLAKPYWKENPTHGNTAYGRLVLDQIRALGGSRNSD